MLRFTPTSPLPALLLGLLALLPAPALAQAPKTAIPGLNKQALLERQTFWDNQDWDWYKTQIPFFECPDEEINTTYYYRWELITKHLTYGSPASGYVFTEFIDRPFWSGRYGAISCPAGHQLYEVRWLRDPRIARDYTRYWFQTQGAQPRNYSTWIADAAWALELVHPDRGFTTGLLPDLIQNFKGWEARHWVPERGLFWQTGHDDGMEFNILSRQTKDKLRGAPSFRPSFNSYMWADARAISQIAQLGGQAEVEQEFSGRANTLKATIQKSLWDPTRSFFFPMLRDDETADGFTMKAGTLTHQTGKFAGDTHGREEIGFVPWQFSLPDKDQGFEAAWKTLMDPKFFMAPFGPTTVEQHDPMFVLEKYCCVWSGQSWPYATTQTLKALANLLQEYSQPHVTAADYTQLLGIYARTHRKQGKPYIAEAANPDTGSWEFHDGYNHSEHYFHSGFNDLVISGLVGLRPRHDDKLEVQPLAPASWDYFALDDVAYQGRKVSIYWDQTGTRYGLGQGLHLVVDGTKVASSPTLGKLVADLPPAQAQPAPSAEPVNLAVNNDGGYYPRLTASSTVEPSSVTKANDGNYWYMPSPPNRWVGSDPAGQATAIALDLGTPRQIHTVKLYVLDDGPDAEIQAPTAIELQTWQDGAWKPALGTVTPAGPPQGHRPYVVQLSSPTVTRLRALLTPRPGQKVGLTEFEAWGPGDQSLEPAPPPAGNLALNTGGEFPKASASFTSMFDDIKRANDGQIIFTPQPNNRWTSFGSKNPTDWLEIDFGQPRTLGRLELAIFDDRGGVQAPTSYTVQTWDGSGWQDVANPKRNPDKPAGGQLNEVQFNPVQTAKVRILFTHRGDSRSGVSEILAWPE